jgi:pimeloyl-ACP methyl ester carboxylesterase
MHEKDFDSQFTHRYAEVNGVQLHYVIGGAGDAVVLLHGWPQTWYEWRKIMPILAQRYTVIAPDLPGLGDSSKSDSGYDKHTVAADIHQLVNQLGFSHINLVGHDLGTMVAYSYAAAHPKIVRRLVLTEAWLPGFGLEDGMDVAKGGLWIFGFHMAPNISEMLTAGKEREYLSTVAYQAGPNSMALTDADIDEYVRHYAAPGGMHSGFEYYRALFQDAEHNRQLAKTKLTMPVLTLVGQNSGNGDRLFRGAQSVAKQVQSDVIENCGHWLAEEQPDALAQKLIAFFDQ